MKLHQLRALVKVIDTGTFSEAALDLQKSQSSISHAVAQLEQSLGTTLLERTASGATPTRFGERVAVAARSILNLVEEIEQATAAERGEVRGAVRLMTFRSVASQILPGVIAALARTHPGVALHLTETHGHREAAIAALAEGRADVAFVQLPLPGDVVHFEVLRDPFVVLRPRGSGRHRKRTEVRWKELADADLITHRDHDSTGLVEQYFDGEIGELRPTYEVQEDTTIVRMVAEGLGWAVVPRLTVDALPENVEMAELPEALERIIGVALAPRALRMPAVRALLNALRERVPGSALPRFSEGVSESGASGEG